MKVIGLIISSVLNKNELTIIKYIDYRYYWEEVLKSVEEANK